MCKNVSFHTSVNCNPEKLVRKTHALLIIEISENVEFFKFKISDFLKIIVA